MTIDSLAVADRPSAGEPSAAPEPASPPPANGAMSGPRVAIAVAVLLGIAVVTALFIGQGAGSGGEDEAVDTGRTAVAFTLPELRPERGEVGVAATPDKPTVVNFFAAWCEPCKRELPALQAAAAARPDIAFLGVDHQDSRLDAIELLDAYGVTYPAGYDPRGDLAARYAVRGLPATVFIAKDGRIIDFHQGELRADELQERLDRLTLQKPAA